MKISRTTSFIVFLFLLCFLFDENSGAVIKTLLGIVCFFALLYSLPFFEHDDEREKRIKKQKKWEEEFEERNGNDKYEY